MREIKFKFWLGSIKKMTNEHDISEICEVITEFTEDIIPLQYTGLKDKNGKEIYEGYILKADNENFVHVIKYYSEFMSFVMVKNNVESDWFHGGNNDYFSDDIKTNYKVIGNIYENPELLER